MTTTESEGKTPYTALNPVADPPADPIDEEAKTRKQARGEKRIKVLRVIQSTLSALLSLAIAIFQGRLYGTYQNTQSTAGAWPKVPDVVPTILLFSVALVALVFDGCMLVGYFFPSSKFARWALRVGGAAQYVMSSTKTVSFAIAAVISKTSYDYGVNSGTNADLWSYTCSDQAVPMEAVIHADSNCNSQWASWAFAIFQVAIEVFGWVISILVFRQTDKKLTHQAMEERLTAYSSNVNGRLADATPQFESGLAA
ncbi:hypothetical protein QBC47DRAFT_416508 [Echria macrotheca]|uniref:MARVEL domain-containing protein n=1 Tax=Echria macrotheca TaxID=438768 RepID=A0AAJ0F662_9PEZI|nr:hypothetical protein QBC47DRAFT_416508 [Echria macrotheca]